MPSAAVAEMCQYSRLGLMSALKMGGVGSMAGRAVGPSVQAFASPGHGIQCCVLVAQRRSGIQLCSGPAGSYGGAGGCPGKEAS
jgi:hypothetical protein